MSKRPAIPPYIFCVKCGSRVKMSEDNSPKAIETMQKHGYSAMAKGICECGVVYVLCYQPLPASPTFSLYFNIYPPEAIKEMLLSKKT